MSTAILATKLYIPLPRPKIVLRPHLIEKLNEGLRQSGGFARKLTLISAPAGFGKTTLLSDWAQPLGGAPVLPAAQSIRAARFHDLSAPPDNFVFVVGDSHRLDAGPGEGSGSVDEAIT